MVQNPPAGSQRIVPYLNYEDAPAAIEFLVKAFGFTERMRMPMPDGRIGHADLAYGDDCIMLASVWSEMGMASPKNLPATHSRVQMYVDDVDAHFAQAKAAGAKIIAEPEDQFYGDRMYRAEDCEGHQWLFSQRVRELNAEEMAAAMKAMTA